LLSAQLCSPVRWRQTLDVLHGLGASHVVELGPGGVLSGLARRTLPGTPALGVQRPEDVDELLEVLAGARHPTDRQDPGHGERLTTSVRLVVSPVAGVFEPETLPVPAPGAGLRGQAPPGPDPGPPVEVGTLIGHVAGVEIRTPFSGHLSAFLALQGERVMAGQPVAWLRVERAE
jgi:[acyl-carrier-protein] S-malonyltransferase